MFSGAIAADGYILLLERIPHKKAQRAVYFQVTVHLVSFMTVVLGWETALPAFPCMGVCTHTSSIIPLSSTALRTPVLRGLRMALSGLWPSALTMLATMSSWRISAAHPSHEAMRMSIFIAKISGTSV